MTFVGHALIPSGICLSPCPTCNKYCYQLTWRFETSRFRCFILCNLGVAYIPPNALQWRHNERDGVSNQRRLDSLPNFLFRRRSKKTSKLRVTGLCEGNSPHKMPVTRKIFPLDDVIMCRSVYNITLYCTVAMAASFLMTFSEALFGTNRFFFYFTWVCS